MLIIVLSTEYYDENDQKIVMNSGVTVDRLILLCLRNKKKDTVTFDP